MFKKLLSGIALSVVLLSVTALSVDAALAKHDKGRGNGHPWSSPGDRGHGHGRGHGNR